MKKLRLIFLVALASVRLLAVESSGAKLLFNSTNLDGWLPMNGGKFFVTNGVIRAEGGKGWLRTERAYTNFICEVEWRGLETNYNSGIFVRAPLDGIPWATNVWQINTKQSAIGELLEGSKKAVPLASGSSFVSKRAVVNYRLMWMAKGLGRFRTSRHAADTSVFKRRERCLNFATSPFSCLLIE